MLFELKFSPDSLINLDASVVDETLAGLLRAHRYGYHVVVINRELCSHFLKTADLRKSDRAMLERLSSEYAQRALLSNSADVFVKVVADSSKDFSIEGNARLISLETLSVSRILDPAVLLVENLRRDGLLYGEILKNHCDLHRCPHPHYEVMHGGGDDLPAVFEAQIKRNRIVCSIVDSDRASPASKNSQKFSNLEKVMRSHGGSLAYAATPPCREAENCLPASLMLELPSGKANASKGHYLDLADAEARINSSPLEAFWLFADLKNGVCAEELAKLSPESRDWIEVKLRTIGLDPNRDQILGFGLRVFDQLLNDNRLLSELRVQSRQKLWREVFDSFVKSVIWIFAGGPRLAT